MSAEKKRLDDLVDTVSSPDTSQLTSLKQLRSELELLERSGGLDGYGLYVYGLVLKKLSLTDLACSVLCESLRAVPAHWGAWLELSCLNINDKVTFGQNILCKKPILCVSST